MKNNLAVMPETPHKRASTKTKKQTAFDKEYAKQDKLYEELYPILSKHSIALVGWVCSDIQRKVRAWDNIYGYGNYKTRFSRIPKGR